MEINLYFVGPDNVVIVDLGIRLLGEKFLFVAIFDAGGASNTRAELKNAAVIALKLVSVTRHVGTRTDETHLSDKYIDQLGKAVHFAMTQPMADAGDAWVVGRGHRVTFSLVYHGTELADFEWLAILSNACLHEENRSFRINFNENGNDQQRNKKHNNPHECHDAVEAPLEEESYFVFISLHAA